jgi:hypothetical protein
MVLYVGGAMKKEEVLELAKQAGGEDWGIFRDFMPEVEKLAALIVERERERAAMICHQCKDWEYASEEIAYRILNQGKE